MITINLEKLILRLSSETKSYPLQADDIAGKTGISRNNIYRILRGENTTVEVVDKLLQCFFQELRSITDKKVSDQELLDSIVEDLIEIKIDKKTRRKKKR